MAYLIPFDTQNQMPLNIDNAAVFPVSIETTMVDIEFRLKDTIEL
jgi:hypothetical protein